MVLSQEQHIPEFVSTYSLVPRASEKEDPQNTDKYGYI